jgi:hypothetical protein
MRQLVENGPHPPPGQTGARYIIRDDGTRMDLRYLRTERVSGRCWQAGGLARLGNTGWLIYLQVNVSSVHATMYISVLRRGCGWLAGCASSRACCRSAGPLPAARVQG